MLQRVKKHLFLQQRASEPGAEFAAGAAEDHCRLQLRPAMNKRRGYAPCLSKACLFAWLDDLTSLFYEAGVLGGDVETIDAAMKSSYHRLHLAAREQPVSKALWP